MKKVNLTDEDMSRISDIAYIDITEGSSLEVLYKNNELILKDLAEYYKRKEKSYKWALASNLYGNIEYSKEK